MHIPQYTESIERLVIKIHFKKFTDVIWGFIIAIEINHLVILQLNICKVYNLFRLTCSCKNNKHHNNEAFE